MTIPQVGWSVVEDRQVKPPHAVGVGEPDPTFEEWLNLGEQEP